MIHWFSASQSFYQFPSQQSRSTFILVTEICVQLCVSFLIFRKSSRIVLSYDRDPKACLIPLASYFRLKEFFKIFPVIKLIIIISLIKCNTLSSRTLTVFFFWKTYCFFVKKIILFSLHHFPNQFLKHLRFCSTSFHKVFSMKTSLYKKHE